MTNMYVKSAEGQNRGEMGLTENHLARIFNKTLCRLCRCSKTSEPCIKPCQCQGPFAHVHQRCIEKWLEATRQNKCDICRFKFIVTLHLPTWFEWIVEKSDTDYFRPLWQLVTRLANVLFISLLSIGLIEAYDHRDDNLDEGGTFTQQILRALLSLWWPAVRLMLVFYLLCHFLLLAWHDFDQWQQINRRVKIHPVDQKNSGEISVASSSTINQLYNSFVRVSGLRHVGQYLKTQSAAALSSSPPRESSSESS